jgi:membrane-bound inhibitor of C-type lysozyme
MTLKLHPTAALLVLALGACSKAPTTPAPEASAPVAGSTPGPVTADPGVITYACKDGQTVIAGYPDKDTAVVTIGGHAYTLKIARSGSGARYTGMGLQWWTKGLTEGQLARLKPGEDIASAPGVACSAKPVEPPEPGTPGGLPDDRTPISEAPFTPESAQGAANVVQTYYADLAMGRADEAAKLRADGVAPDLSPYAEYHAQVGGPGAIGAAAGSLYVEVPVVIYGRLKTGAEVHQSGKAVLRRVNDVPGSTPAQRRWHIERIDLKP